MDVRSYNLSLYYFANQKLFCKLYAEKAVTCKTYAWTYDTWVHQAAFEMLA